MIIFFKIFAKLTFKEYLEKYPKKLGQHNIVRMTCWFVILISKLDLASWPPNYQEKTKTFPQVCCTPSFNEQADSKRASNKNAMREKVITFLAFPGKIFIIVTTSHYFPHAVMQLRLQWNLLLKKVSFCTTFVSNSRCCILRHETFFL